MEAIEIARIAGRHLRIAAKVGTPARRRSTTTSTSCDPPSRTADVEHLGELSSAERDQLYARVYATLMPGNWPEPFGLVAIESLACGTPVRRATRRSTAGDHPRGDRRILRGRPTATGVPVADVERLDRAAIRSSVLERFSATRMADGYLDVYRRVVERPRRRDSTHREGALTMTDNGKQPGANQSSREQGAHAAHAAESTAEDAVEAAADTATERSLSTRRTEATPCSDERSASASAGGRRRPARGRRAPSVPRRC